MPELVLYGIRELAPAIPRIKPRHLGGPPCNYHTMHHLVQPRPHAQLVQLDRHGRRHQPAQRRLVAAGGVGPPRRQRRMPHPPVEAAEGVVERRVGRRVVGVAVDQGST